MSSPHITDLLDRVRSGDSTSQHQLIQLVYAELHRVARRQGAGAGQSIGATSLVHEAYFKLFHGAGLDVKNRGHFFAVAAVAMRQVIVDRARAHVRQKRGGERQQVSLNDNMAAIDTQADDAIALDDALQQVEALSPRLRRVVDCRFFAGLTEEETAEALGVTSRTVRSDWVKARALLRSIIDAPKGVA